LQKSKIKTMLITYLTSRVWFINNLCLKGRLSVLSTLWLSEDFLSTFQWVRPQFRAEGGWFLLHDNAPSHSAPVVKIFLAEHGVVEISHPPYSRDLAPADLFLFPTMNSKERNFRMLTTLRKTWRPNWIFLWRPLLFSKTSWTMQQMYSSRRRLLWIEIKQFCIYFFTPFRELYCQTTYTRPLTCWVQFG
jgi:hypothetical protein